VKFKPDSTEFVPKKNRNSAAVVEEVKFKPGSTEFVPKKNRNSAAVVEEMKTATS
jgi:hypothetical protein